MTIFDFFKIRLLSFCTAELKSEDIFVLRRVRAFSGYSFCWLNPQTTCLFGPCTFPQSCYHVRTKFKILHVSFCQQYEQWNINPNVTYFYPSDKACAVTRSIVPLAGFVRNLPWYWNGEGPLCLAGLGFVPESCLGNKTRPLLWQLVRA